MANKITKKVIKDLKDRQEYAFDIVYLKYHKLVYSIIYEIVYDKELSKDLSQDTFIKMLEFSQGSIHGFESRTDYHAYY